MRRLGAIALAAAVAACGRDAREAPSYTVTVDVGPSIAALADDTAEIDRDAAIERLAGLGPDALPVIDAALARENAAVRGGLVDVLGSMEEPAATARLVVLAAQDDDATVRAQAVTVLAARETPDAAQAVVRALDDPNASVHRTAAAACGAHCTSPGALARRLALALQPPVGADTLRIAGGLGEVLQAPDAEAAARLRAMLIERAVPLLRPDTPPDVRAVAALLTLDVDRDAALAALVGTAGGTGLPVTLRATVLQSLGRLGGGDAVPVVRAALDDPTMRLPALTALRALQARGVAGASVALAAAQPPRPVAP